MAIKEFAKNRKRNNKGQFVIPDKPSSFNRKEYRKQYYLRNREIIIKKSVDWGRKNKDKRKTAKNKWRAKNKELTNFLTRRYIYRKKNAIGRHSLEEIKWLYDKFPTCPYCNTNKSNTIDHIIPLSRGGTNVLSNLIAVCVNCNSKKGSKTLSEWNPMLNYQFNQLARAARFNK